MLQAISVLYQIPPLKSPSSKIQDSLNGISKIIENPQSDSNSPPCQIVFRKRKHEENKERLKPCNDEVEKLPNVKSWNLPKIFLKLKCGLTCFSMKYHVFLNVFWLFSMLFMGTKFVRYINLFCFNYGCFDMSLIINSMLCITCLLI